MKLFSDKTFVYALKCITVATISIAITNFFGLGHGYWCTMTSLLLLSETYEETLNKSLKRFLMTLAGTISAGIIIIVLEKCNIPLLSIPAILSLFFALYYSKTSYTISMYFIAFSVISLFSFLFSWSPILIWHRSYETGLGAVIAFLVSYYMFPSSSSKKYLEKLQEVIALELDFFTKLNEHFFDDEIAWSVGSNARRKLKELHIIEDNIFFGKLFSRKKVETEKRLSRLLHFNFVHLANISYTLKKISISEKNTDKYIEYFIRETTRDFLNLQSFLDNQDKINIQNSKPNATTFSENDIDFISLKHYINNLKNSIKATNGILVESKLFSR